MLWKKAQTATEYLIILAVVIVVALVVVGVMGGIPGIGAGVGSKASASYWQSANIAIDSVANGETSGNLSVTVRNAMATTVTLDAFAVDGVDMLATSGPVSLSPGQSRQLVEANSCTAGNAFSYGVSITYTDINTGESYTIDGDGHRLQGTCAN